jgi:hypothetical protein
MTVHSAETWLPVNFSKNQSFGCDWVTEKYKYIPMQVYLTPSLVRHKLMKIKCELRYNSMHCYPQHLTDSSSHIYALVALPPKKRTPGIH